MGFFDDECIQFVERVLQTRSRTITQHFGREFSLDRETVISGTRIDPGLLRPVYDNPKPHFFATPRQNEVKHEHIEKLWWKKKE